MSVYSKSNPIGIDSVIEPLNNLIASTLYDLWSLTDDNSEFYNRVYKIEEGNGQFKPFGFITSYKDVLFNSKKYCISFFYVNDNSENSLGLYSSSVVHIIQINLDKIYTHITHRADEEIRKDLCQIYDRQPLQVILNRVSFQPSEVFGDFNLDVKDYKDMQPFLNLRFDLTIKYRYK